PILVLRDVGALLIDIHGQHEFQSLLRGGTQRDLLDDFGEQQATRARVAEHFRTWQEQQRELMQLQQSVQQRDARLEVLRHHANEIAALQLAEGEVPRLSAEAGRLANRGRLAQAARAAVDLLYESEGANAHDLTARALTQLRHAAALDERLAPIMRGIESAAGQLREAAQELLGYLDDLDVDPARQEFVEQRLAAIEAVARKHRVAAEELPVKHAELTAELQLLESADRNLARLGEASEKARAAWLSGAQRLSAARQSAAKKLSRAITVAMQTLGMAGGHCEIEVTAEPAAEPAPHGFDSVQFLFSANPGQPLRPIAKVASGGELSRISLAVQVSLAGTESRCLVFDEVDAGVGGAVAEIVGRELANLGRRAQVLCVTHLPQVAAQADHQFKVAKLTDGTTTRTIVTPLSDVDRIEEIARMLGGIAVTARARTCQRNVDLAAGHRRRPQAPRVTCACDQRRRGQSVRRHCP
ncbi:MAG: DNA repair protein RecN, partial [Steroidobacteraceae bacterium]|nr:DNA repair protein RecN [Steroidobacteraceae bacterium]